VLCRLVPAFLKPLSRPNCHVRHWRAATPACGVGSLSHMRRGCAGRLVQWCVTVVDTGRHWACVVPRAAAADPVAAACCFGACVAVWFRVSTPPGGVLGSLAAGVCGKECPSSGAYAARLWRGQSLKGLVLNGHMDGVALSPGTPALCAHGACRLSTIHAVACAGCTVCSVVCGVVSCHYPLSVVGLGLVWVGGGSGHLASAALKHSCCPRPAVQSCCHHGFQAPCLGRAALCLLQTKLREEDDRVW